MRTLRSIPLLFAFYALLNGTALLAQNSAIAPRITAQVDERSLTTLRGNVPRMARAEYDQGEAAPSTELSHMRLVLARSSAQKAALDQYLAELQDPSLSNYHKWLTPAQFGQLYGPADADVATLVSWLQSQGLTVENIPPGRTDISFSGTVSQVEAAFHTSIHSFQVNQGQVNAGRANGQQFYSNITDPQIPSAFAPVVRGVAHLNTIRPQPELVHGSAGRFNSETRQMEPMNAVGANGIQADLTTGSGTSSSPYTLYVVPGDAATIYDTPNSFNAKPSGESYTGTGVSIGIGGDAIIDAGIVETYRSVFLGSSTEPTIYYCTNSSFSSCSSSAGSGYDAGDADEAYLDNELAGGLAPGASIYYYASPDLISGIEAALTKDAVDIFSLSFGECEQGMSTSDNAQIESMWQQAAAEGITVTVSAGDTGAAGCDDPSAKGGGNAPDAVGGLAVNGLASTPYNIAVGGTDFYPLVNSFASYVSTSQGSASTDYRTALGYIPESTWNDSSYNDTTISQNEPLSAAGYSAGANNIVAGGGGHSSCSINNSVDESNGSVINGSCISGYSKPAWQTGTGSYDSDGVRDIPDVSLMSGNGFDSATWLVCDNETRTNSENVSETLNCEALGGNFYFDGFGGTSTAAPALAGILALVQQETGSRLGQAAQTLYELYNGSYKNAIFHDVQVGNNSVACTSGTPDCVADSLGYYFESGYDTGTGYDLATGMGSVDATQLVNDWSTATTAGPVTPVVTVNSVSPNPATTAQSIAVVVAVSGSSGTPTGTVTLASGSYSSGAVTLAGSGSCTASSCVITIPANSLSAGTDTLTATYSGDGNYASGTGTASVTVTPSAFALAATTPAAIAPGGSSTSTITVSSATGYAGTVTLTCALISSPAGASYLPSCSSGSSTVTLSSGTTSGTATVTVSTTAATSELSYPRLPGKGRGLLGAGGGAVLAFLLFLGVPARRRGWRSMLGVLMGMAVLGSLTGCSGGGSTGGGSSGTTTGTYTFTVTGTGSPTITPSPSATFTVIVN